MLVGRGVDLTSSRAVARYKCDVWLAAKDVVKATEVKIRQAAVARWFD